MPVLLEARPALPEKAELLGDLSGWSASYLLRASSASQDIEEAMDLPVGTELLHAEDLAILSIVARVSGADENPPRSSDYDEDE
jgi:hypothetical protein